MRFSLPEFVKNLSPRVKVVTSAVIITVLVLIAMPMVASSSPGYFARYHLLAKSQQTLADSSHKGIACDACHADSRGEAVYRVAVAVDFYTSIVKKSPQPTLLTFGKPRKEACLACHAGDWSDDIKRTSKIPHPAHARVAGESRECVTCHKWTGHQEASMEKHKEMPFSGVCVSYGCHVGTKQTDQCATCHHILGDAQKTWKQDHAKVALTTGSNSCLETCHETDQCRECHTTGKRPKFTGLAVQTGFKAIEEAHAKPNWTDKHGSVALQDQSKCMKCHVSDGECRSCHTQRPKSHGSTDSWIGQHKKPGENERRCLACHKKPWCEDCHKQFKEMR